MIPLTLTGYLQKTLVIEKRMAMVTVRYKVHNERYKRAVERDAKKVDKYIEVEQQNNDNIY